MKKPTKTSAPLRLVRPAPQLAPVERDLVNEKIYVQLSEALRRGDFEAGQALSLRTLAATFEVSLMPVRDAVARLVNEGVLETLANRTVRVPLLTIEQYEGLTEARIAVEGHAAYLAAKRIDEAGLSALMEANKRLMRAAKRADHASIMEANEDVHFSVYRAAKSPKLLQVISNLWKQSGPYLATIENAMASNTAMRGHDFGAAQHNNIYDALRARDAELARKTLVDDIEGFAQIYKQLFPAHDVRVSAGPSED
ncbi:GntR family transcriptional regulator [Variovorax paradoxus]|uniref:GntR family transcriptional regulator n=1 Tax=Variovorax paradoxus TaxID=34073 RepID=UPI0019349F83|nr:GntR family transcriptional regulator [Variovorax paradoxus]